MKHRMFSTMDTTKLNIRWVEQQVMLEVGDGGVTKLNIVKAMIPSIASSMSDIHR